ncbi:transcriptional repressor NrdR [Candidatus Woesearchaeota archaeon]|nr:transcriptional repressor NrdR [Candidatus Woesearchaeota archaeon]
MKCPYCSNQETKVLDKRETENDAVTRRRRQCLACEKRFTTYEHIEMVDLHVIKKEGKREQFDRQKLKNGVLKACEKRPIPSEKIDELVSQVEAELLEMDSTEITSAKLGEMVMKKLKKLDKVAYIRFASVYRDFADLTEFKEELDKMLGAKGEQKK